MTATKNFNKFFVAVVDRPPSIIKYKTYSKEEFLSISDSIPKMTESEMRRKFQGRQLEVVLNYLYGNI